ncbi:MAG: asparagine synthase (glutamine-hydrolyzing) [Thermodesulfobacteriota bacterium]|nr:asparagine synthase (glutamine-hydrolyzing) [Thermodesulfobacteriota bacterium]
MCGIFGMLALQNQINPEKFNLPNSTDIIKHRGPDDYGYFMDDNIYLGHRRLSVIDLKTGQQPVYNEDKTKCVIYNGEIYNFQEIRKNLISCGHTFITSSDTETIIHAYEEWDKDCVAKFNGMFSFAIWDTKKKKLFAARDRLGIKPFFYAEYKGIFYFASEMKAILQFKDFPREIDQDALASYFMLSYIPAPLTIYKQIRKLLPGHTIEVKKGAVKINKYWDLDFYPDHSKSQKQIIEHFSGLLEESVRLRMISDVPLGAFLSGGIDSGIIVALMSKNSSMPINTFCMGFGGNVGGYLDERDYANQVAFRFGADHVEHIVEPDPQNIIENIVNSFDEPFADHSTIPSYYLCQKTREKVTVALSGLGGDELFGGYERYLGFKLSSLYNKLPSFLCEKLIKSIVQKIPERADGHYTINHLKRFVRSANLPQDIRYLNFFSRMDVNKKQMLFSSPENYKESFNNCQELILSYFNAKNASNPLDRVFYCDIKTYLPEDILACTDRMSMRHSLEVRVPFLDHNFMEFCATIPNEMKIKLWDKKHILKKAALKLLPKEVVKHRKQGFVGPMSIWMQTDLKNYIIDILSEENLNRHGLFNYNTVSTILHEHFNRIENNDALIWSLVIFQVWYNNYIN